MNPFDLHQLITQGNRAGKAYRQSMNAALAVRRGEDVSVLSPDEDSAKDFIDQVKKRLEEIGELEPPGKIERINSPKRGFA
jgi:ornithine cyclodeaminase/alanine dehydrogenase-like protein (mu-crystallin family)